MLASQFHRGVPAISKGYPLPPLFSVVVPIARTNICTNPSLETGTALWGPAHGASTARTTVQQYHGAYSLAVTPTATTNDGCAHGLVALTSGQLYAMSCKFLGVAGKPYRISIADSGASEIYSGPSFRATGRWEWRWIYYKETSSASRYVFVQKAGDANTATFYVDGLQIEAINAGEYVSTYIDGDQQGLIANQSPPAYVWSGTPHASTSSRSGQTRAGGMVMRLDYYGFVLLTMIGLGLPIPTNISQGYVQLDGAAYERTSKGPRQFTLGGRFDAATFPQLQRQMSDLSSVLDRDLVATQQPLTLLYQGLDGCDAPTSDTGRIICSYQGGLEGVTDNQHAEQTSAVFRQWLPTILSDSEAGVAFGAAGSVPNANAILQRSPDGAWTALGTGGDGAGPIVDALAIGLDGTLYAGGFFPTMSGVANTAGIAKWNGSTWSAMTTGVSGGGNAVKTIAVAPNGDIYVGGSFALAGGVANTVGIARWNGSAWSALGTGCSGGSATVEAIVFGPDGTLYAGGGFGSMGGVANTVGLAKWNGSAWSALGTGLSGGSSDGGTLAVGPDGLIYVGGNFTTANGVSASNIAKWDGTTFTALSSGTNNTVSALVFRQDGLLIAGGLFTTAGGVSASRIAIWNGSLWDRAGVGVNNTVYALHITPASVLYLGGIFTTAGGVTLPDSAARWTGTSTAGVYSPLDIDFPGAATVYAFTSRANGTLYVGFDKIGTATGGASPTQTVTNPGTARAYPTLRITGPTSGISRIFQLVNYTTGRAIYLNYIINAGETATFVFDPAFLSFTSDFQGNIISKILPGSNEADFFLQPGANTVYFQWDGAVGVGALLRWRPAFNSYHDLTP